MTLTWAFFVPCNRIAAAEPILLCNVKKQEINYPENPGQCNICYLADFPNASNNCTNVAIQLSRFLDFYTLQDDKDMSQMLQTHLLGKNTVATGQKRRIECVRHNQSFTSACHRKCFGLPRDGRRTDFSNILCDNCLQEELSIDTLFNPC